MRRMRFKVSYTLKNENKLLEDYSLGFNELRLAIIFMKQLAHIDGFLGGKLVGKPIIERM